MEASVMKAPPLFKVTIARLGRLRLVYLQIFDRNSMLRCSAPKATLTVRRAQEEKEKKKKKETLFSGL